jgi:hypothetical protein
MSENARAMAKRDKRSPFIAELREAAKKRGLRFRFEKWRGKCSHGMVFVGDKVSSKPGDRSQDREQDQEAPRSRLRRRE